MDGGNQLSEQSNPFLGLFNSTNEPNNEVSNSTVQSNFPLLAYRIFGKTMDYKCFVDIISYGVCMP